MPRRTKLERYADEADIDLYRAIDKVERMHLTLGKKSDLWPTLLSLREARPAIRKHMHKTDRETTN